MSQEGRLCLGPNRRADPIVFVSAGPSALCTLAIPGAGASGACVAGVRPARPPEGCGGCVPTAWVSVPERPSGPPPRPAHCLCAAAEGGLMDRGPDSGRLGVGVGLHPGETAPSRAFLWPPEPSPM